MKMMPTSRSASGLVEIALGNSLLDMKNQNFCTRDLIVVDPPFNWEPMQIIPWVDEAVRICKPDGNIIVFNGGKKITRQLGEVYRKADSNVKKWNIYRDLDLRDFITVMHTHAKPKLNSLPTQSMFLAVLSKRIDRKLYTRIPKSLVNIWDPESLGFITDNWSRRNHRAGHHGKFSVLSVGEDQTFKHSTATAEWVIETVLNCYARPGDSVYDCFGGAGTVPYLCEEYGIKCRSVELDNKHFTIMQERLLKSTTKNRDFANFAAKLMDKVNGLQSRATDRLESGLQGSIENRGKILESGFETIRKMG